MQEGRAPAAEGDGRYAARLCACHVAVSGLQQELRQLCGLPTPCWQTQSSQQTRHTKSSLPTAVHAKAQQRRVIQADECTRITWDDF